MSQTSSSALKAEQEEIKILWQYCKTLKGLVTAALTLMPIGGLVWQPLTPPWPKNGAPVLATFLSLVALLFLYYWYRDGSESAIRTGAGRLIIFSIALLLIYVFMLAYFVIDIDEKRVIQGLWLTDEAKDLVSRGLVSKTPNALLGYYGYDSEDLVWEGCWAVKGFLVLSFSGLFVCAAGCSFLFIMKKLVRERQKP